MCGTVQRMYVKFNVIYLIVRYVCLLIRNVIHVIPDMPLYIKQVYVFSLIFLNALWFMFIQMEAMTVKHVQNIIIQPVAGWLVQYTALIFIAVIVNNKLYKSVKGVLTVTLYNWKMEVSLVYGSSRKWQVVI